VGQTDSVFQFNGSSWIEYASYEEAIESNFTAIMTSINKDWIKGSSSSLWAVEKPAGLWIMNRFEDVRFYNGESWTIYTPDKSGLSIDYIAGIAVDHQGTIWIANDLDQYSNGGLNKFVPFPDFELVASSIIFLERGQDTTENIIVRHLRGWVPTTTLSITGLPSGVSASFEPNPVTPTAQVELTLTSAQTTPLGTYNLNLTAITGDGLSRTINLTFYVVEEAFYIYLPAIFKP
jgi:hypothetical protein